MQAAALGDIFPLWGTCLGFELLNTITAGQNLLQPVDAENITLPLDLVDGNYSIFLPIYMYMCVFACLHASKREFFLCVSTFLCCMSIIHTYLFDFHSCNNYGFDKSAYQVICLNVHFILFKSYLMNLVKLHKPYICLENF